VAVSAGGSPDLEEGTHQAYQLTRGPSDGTTLPGLVFFGDLSTEQKAVHVRLLPQITVNSAVRSLHRPLQRVTDSIDNIGVFSRRTHTHRPRT
jgi:hypothetical protein